MKYKNIQISKLYKKIIKKYTLFLENNLIMLILLILIRMTTITNVELNTNQILITSKLFLY